eukprot:Seg1908.6 transcript_id=Seg1908.6/GoldUCD/mRNA.D3Y31 product="hypothetical protein" protein_id=Seg1908.6/GoldUCD/D3Y31
MEKRHLVFIIAVCFLTTESLTPNNSSQICKNGIINVTCNWNDCNGSLLRPFFGDKEDGKMNTSAGLTVHLYKGHQRIWPITKTRSGNMFSFAVKFSNTLQQRNTIYTCVWGNWSALEKGSDKVAEICRNNVSIDLRSIPSQPQNLSLFFIDYFMITLRYNVPERYDKEMQRYYVSYYQYDYTLKSCPVKIGNRIMIQKIGIACTHKKAEVSCPENAVLFAGRVYNFVANVENSFGQCFSEPLCKTVTNYDLYGDIKNVKVGVVLIRKDIALNVSWVYPRNLILEVSQVTFKIRYCSQDQQCSHKDEIRKRGRGIGTYALIEKGVKYDTNYSVQLQYKICASWKCEFSPWTIIVDIVTPSKIPDHSPSITKCDQTRRKLLMSWENNSPKDDNVKHFNLKIETPQRRDTVIVFPIANCTKFECSFEMSKTQQRYAVRITVSSCSNSGCDRNSISSCLFMPSPVSRHRKDKIDWKSICYKIVLPTVLTGLLLLCLLFVYKKTRKNTEKDNIFIIVPRGPTELDSFESSEPSPEPENHYERFFGRM